MKNVWAVLLGTTVIFAGTGFSVGKFVIGPAEAAQVEGEVAALDHEGSSEDGDHAGAEKVEPTVVEIGRVMVPVYGARTIRYVVANMAVAVSGEENADFIKTEAGTTKVRDEIISTMMAIGEKTDKLSGVNIDSTELSEMVFAGIQQEFEFVGEVLFLNLMHTDMKRT